MHRPDEGRLQRAVQNEQPVEGLKGHGAGPAGRQRPPDLTLFERITLVDVAADTITPLYVATRENLLSGSTGLKALAREYAERLIFPEDREAYRQLMDFDALEGKLQRAGRTNISRYLRTLIRHGEYAWKQYIVLRLKDGVYMELIRNVHADLLRFMKNHHLGYQAAGGETVDAPEVLWRNLIQSDIEIGRASCRERV